MRASTTTDGTAADPKANGGFSRKELVGVGAAACVACCAVPLAVLLASAGLLSLVGVLAFGTVGLLVLVPAAIAVLRRRRPSSEGSLR